MPETIEQAIHGILSDRHEVGVSEMFSLLESRFSRCVIGIAIESMVFHQQIEMDLHWKTIKKVARATNKVVYHSELITEWHDVTLPVQYQVTRFEDGSELHCFKMPFWPTVFDGATKEIALTKMLMFHPLGKAHRGL